MDRYEFNIKIEQIKKLMKKKDFATAVKIVDVIEWRKVKENPLLIMAADVYEITGKYDQAREVLLIAYERTGLGRQLAYRLCRLSVKCGDYEGAEEFYDEFVENSPRDAGKYILLYEIAKCKNEPIEKQIEILEKFIEEDMDDRWAYTLARLYHKAHLREKCVELCDTIILWFADGKYVEKALELKQIYVPLSENQRLKYEAQKSKKTEAKESRRDDTIKHPVIPLDATREVKLDDKDAIKDGAVLDAVHEMDIDVNSIHVKDFSVNNKYDTMNIQKELAKNVKSFVDSNTGIFKPVSANNDNIDDEKVNEQITGQLSLEEVLKMFEDGEFDKKSEEEAVAPVEEAVVLEEFVEETSDEVYEESLEENLEENLEETPEEDSNDEALIEEESIEDESIEDEVAEAEEAELDVEVEAIQEEVEDINIEGAGEEASEIEEIVEYTVDLDGLDDEVSETEETEQETEEDKEVEDVKEVESEETEGLDDDAENDSIDEVSILAKLIASEMDIDEKHKKEAESEGLDGDMLEDVLKVAEQEDSDGEDSNEEDVETISQIDSDTDTNTETNSDAETSEEISVDVSEDEKATEIEESEEALDEKDEEAFEVEDEESKGNETEEEAKEVAESVKEETSEKVVTKEKQSDIAKREIKNFVTKYSGINGLDRQILKVMQSILKTEVIPVKYILVEGEVKSGKTTIGIDVIKIANKIIQRRDQKIAKLKGSSLNNKSIDSLVKALDGSDILVEKISEIEPEKFVEFVDKINDEAKERIIIFEDEKTLVENFLKKLPDGYADFVNVIDIKVKKINDWTKIAEQYANSKGYAIDEMGKLALSAKIDRLGTITLVVHKNHVEQIIDGAIADANKFGIGKLFARFKKKTEEGYKILTEKNFAE